MLATVMPTPLPMQTIYGSDGQVKRKADEGQQPTKKRLCPFRPSTHAQFNQNDFMSTMWQRQQETHERLHKLEESHADIMAKIQHQQVVPTRLFTEAMRQVVQQPSPTPKKFPSNQEASTEQLLACRPLGRVLFNVLTELTHGAWIVCQPFIILRCNALRELDVAVTQPLLWSWHTTDDGHPKQQYVFLERDAERYLKLVLAQRAPSGMRQTDNESMQQWIIRLTATVAPGVWP